LTLKNRIQNLFDNPERDRIFLLFFGGLWFGLPAGLAVTIVADRLGGLAPIIQRI
jgi:hypothetical protein